MSFWTVESNKRHIERNVSLSGHRKMQVFLPGRLNHSYHIVSFLLAIVFASLPKWVPLHYMIQLSLLAYQVEELLRTLWERELPASAKLTWFFSGILYQFNNHLKLSMKESSLRVFESKWYHSESPSEARFEDFCVNLIFQVGWKCISDFSRFGVIVWTHPIGTICKLLYF